MNIWYALEQKLTLTYEEIKPNPMCVTSNSMLQFLLSPEMQFLNKIKACMMMLDVPKLERGEVRYLLEKLGLLQSTSAMNE